MRWLLILCTTSAPALAEESVASPHVTVLGRLQVSALLSNTKDGITVAGRLTDEHQVPVNGNIGIEQPRDRNFEACRASTSAGLNRPAMRRAFPTSADGRFCLHAPGPRLDAVVLRASAPHHQPALATAESQETATPFELGFVHTPRNVTVGASEVYGVTARASSEAPPVENPQAQLGLQCGNQRQTLATSDLLVNGLNRFEFTGQDLVLFGECQFQLSIEPAAETAPVGPAASLMGFAQTPVRSLVRPVLSIATLDESTDDPIALEVRASLPGIQVPNDVVGVIQVAKQGRFLKSCALRHGRCQLSLRRSEAPQTIEISLTPGSSLLLPAETLTLTLRPHGPPIVSNLIKLTLLLIFGYWLLRSWRGNAAFTPAQPLGPRAAGVVPSGSRAGPVQGQVTDTHTEEPVSGAELALIEVRPDSEHILETSQTAANGRFSMTTHLSPRRLLRIRIVAKGYGPLESEVSASKLAIRLTNRRRDLISQMLRWARTEGIPFSPRVPGPADIAAHEELSHRDTSAHWIAHAAKAAYSAHPPSESDVTVLSDRQRR